MHIELEQQLQRMDAAVTDDFFEKEFDIALNKAMNEFIDDHYDPLQNPKRQGLGDSLQNILDLQALRKEVQLPLFVDDLRPEKRKVYLPSDFWLHEEILPHTFNNCKGLDLSASPSVDVYYWAFSLDDQDSSKYDDLSLVINGNTLFDASDFPRINEAIEVDDEHYILRELLIREVLRNKGWHLYWERYDSLYEKGKFILVNYDTSALVSTDLEISLNGTTTNVAMQTLSQTKDLSEYNNQSLVFEIYPGRIPETEQLEQYLKNSFGKPTYDSPVVDISDDHVIVYTNSTYISTLVNIKYIRKPASINLFLKSDCELHPRVHPAIVDRAAKHLKAVIENERGFKLAVADRATND